MACSNFDMVKNENFWLFPWNKKHLSIISKWLLFYKKGKILHFWPCQESKWAISCRNGKTPLQIFHMLYSIWQTVRKLIEGWKNIGGKSTHFCLGPKTGNGHWDPCFAIRSKIHVFCRTISWEVWILVLNRNRARKSLCHDLAILRNQLS